MSWAVKYGVPDNGRYRRILLTGLVGQGVLNIGRCTGATKDLKVVVVGTSGVLVATLENVV
jgi:hypothetical protein